MEGVQPLPLQGFPVVAVAVLGLLGRTHQMEKAATVAQACHRLLRAQQFCVLVAVAEVSVRVTHLVWVARVVAAMDE